ncbi:hypothetical protein JCM3766R1_003928 [Sporobolomyces carnicolor]
MAHIHPGNPGTPAPTNTNPFGSKNSCGRANLKLTEFVKLAQEAWYSKKPTVKHANHTEFRKHPDHDRYFHLKEYDGHYYVAYASEAVDRQPVFEVNVTGYDHSEHWITESDREALQKQPLEGELGFLANKGEDDSVAFEHLGRLLELRNLEVGPLIQTVEEKRRTPFADPRVWRGIQGQYFRYTDDDRDKIEEHNRDRRSRAVYRRPAQPHASLSHRKLALYGLTNRAHSDLF